MYGIAGVAIPAGDTTAAGNCYIATHPVEGTSSVMAVDSRGSCSGVRPQASPPADRLAIGTIIIKTLFSLPPERSDFQFILFRAGHACNSVIQSPRFTPGAPGGIKTRYCRYCIARRLINMDKVASVIACFLILSVITEKCTTIIKLSIRPLRNPRFLKEHEKQRELWITLVSFLVGLAIVTLFDLPIQALVRGDDPLQALDAGMSGAFDRKVDISWPGFLVVCGYFATALALSLGSKFWQDLLDFMLEARRLKGALQLESAARAGESRSLAVQSRPSLEKIVEDILSYYGPQLMKVAHVVGVGIGVDTSVSPPLPTLRVQLDSTIQTSSQSLMFGTPMDQLPTSIVFPIPSGDPVVIPVETSITGQARSMGTTIVPSAPIANKNSIHHAYGTFGCVVRVASDSTELLLTCYHAVKSPNQSWGLFDPSKAGENVAVDPKSQQVIGKIIKAVRNDRLDIALVEPDPGLEITTTVPAIGKLREIRALTRDDIYSQVRVQMVGAVSKYQAGIIPHGGIWKLKVQYPDNSLWELYDLIPISKPDLTPLSQPGDSGAVVADMNGYALGIVVASDDVQSYAIPFTTIRDRLNVNIA